MTTDVQAAQDLYNQLRPGAAQSVRQYVLTRTPATLQDEMLSIMEADLASLPTAPPTVVDAPFVSQTGTGIGSVMSCTMGNWNGTPTSRTYQWKRGATVVGTNAASYTVVALDIGQSMTCTMVATNGLGASAPVVSNAVVAV